MNKEQKVIEAATLLAESLHPDDVRTRDQWDLVKTLRRILKEEPELITMDGEYQYRNGEPARILCTDAGGDWSVISLPKNGKPLTHKSDGSYSITGKDVDYDLIPVKKEPREWYLEPLTQQTPNHFDANLYNSIEGIETKSTVIKVREVLK